MLYIILPIALLGFLFWFGWGNIFNQKNDLAVKEVYGGDFGLISKFSEPISKTFTIVNNGEDSEIIAKIYTDCRCLSVSVPIGGESFGPFSVPVEENTKPLDIGIPAGGEMKINLTFNHQETSRDDFLGEIFIETLRAEEILAIPIKANIVQ